VRSGLIDDDEVCEVDGMRCTAAARTAYDFGRRLPLNTAVIRIDALLNATQVPLSRVEAVAQRYPGARNVRRLHSALALVDAGAESPPETRLRLLLVRAELPRPVTQIPVGRRRIDMGWPEYLVGVEYDGEQHWTDPDRYADDIERLEFLASRGWLIVRVSARHLRYDARGVVVRVRQALRSRGCVVERTVVCGSTRRLRTTSVRSAR
jgi:very-short-patch-repair endonuclease